MGKERVHYEAIAARDVKPEMDKFLRWLNHSTQSSEWAKICKCSQDTAIRDIKDLIEKNILQQANTGGRSTSYKLRVQGEC